MSGGGGPSQTTVTQSNIPDWLRPQVETVLGGATKQLFNTREIPGVDGAPSTFEITGTKPFIPYSARPQDYVAGFSPLQQQVQFNAANLQVPQQFQQGTQFAQAAGLGGLGSAQQAANYGRAGFQAGAMGQQLGMAAAQQAEARARAAEQAAAGFGQEGFMAGQRGEGIGAGALQDAIARANMATFAAQQAGAQGQQSGLLGQQLGILGGERYGQMGAGYGAQAAGLAPEAQMYGRTAADIGQMGLRAESLGRDITEQARGYAQQGARAGKDYGLLLRSPQLMQQYLSPYQAAVTDVQLQGLQRQADIAAQGRKSAAARAGAFGGARQAIENAEANRALQTQMDAVRAQGLQSAYDRAVQAIQAGMGFELQGVGAANQSLGTALQGGQLGLSGIGQAMAGQQAGLAGLGQAGQLYGLGMQGAGMGLQGLQQQLAGTAQGMQGAQFGLSAADRAIAAGQLAQQGAQTGLAGTAQAMQGAQAGLSGLDRAIAAGQLGLQGADRGLAGTAQAMQGAGVGLQGVTGQQAGYGLANQAAGAMGTLGNQQLAAQTGILGLQNQIGAQQQAQQQQIINQAIQNYAQAREAPMNAMQQYNALLRGYAVPGTTATQYQAAPALASQLGGLGMAAYGLSGLTGGGKKKGGAIKESDGLDKLALRNALAGA